MINCRLKNCRLPAHFDRAAGLQITNGQVPVTSGEIHCMFLIGHNLFLAGQIETVVTLVTVSRNCTVNFFN